MNLCFSDLLSLFAPDCIAHRQRSVPVPSRLPPCVAPDRSASSLSHQRRPQLRSDSSTAAQTVSFVKSGSCGTPMACTGAVRLQTQPCGTASGKLYNLSLDILSNITGADNGIHRPSSISIARLLYKKSMAQVGTSVDVSEETLMFSPVTSKRLDASCAYSVVGHLSRAASTRETDTFKLNYLSLATQYSDLLTKGIDQKGAAVHPAGDQSSTGRHDWRLYQVTSPRVNACCTHRLPH